MQGAKIGRFHVVVSCAALFHILIPHISTDRSSSYVISRFFSYFLHHTHPSHRLPNLYYRFSSLSMNKDQDIELFEGPISPMMAPHVEDGTLTHRSPDEVDMARLGKKQVLKVGTMFEK